MSNNLSLLRPPDWSAHQDLWERAIEIGNGPWPDFTPCFIYRDYHPMNMLSQAGHLCGVIDWANACVGPAGIDVAWCRHNLVGMYGVEVSDRFLVHCQSAMKEYWTYHPFWDLITLVELLSGPPDVYPPWLDFGLPHLTDALVTERDERYLASLLERYDRL